MLKSRLLEAVGIVAVVGAIVSVTAQTPASPAFEVASVKLNKSRDGERTGDLSGGRFTMTYATLRDLVAIAYLRDDGHVRYDSQIAGGPGWFNTDHFDVVANAAGVSAGLDASGTAAGASTSAELSSINRVRLMLRTLLAGSIQADCAQRIPRASHFTRSLMDRTDGKFGPQLKKVDVDCATQRDSICGGFRASAPGHYTGHGVTMSMVGTLLEGSVGRDVFDRTGLAGTFDVELQWTPDQPQGPDATQPPAGDLNGPSIFTAVREQLGLKLVATRGPVDVLVIDHVERPTEN